MSSSWNCHTCTFVNPSDTLTCNMCGSANPSPAPSTTLPCPICNQPQPIANIESHVNACLSGGGSAPPAAPHAPVMTPPGSVIDLTSSKSFKSLTSTEQVHLLQRALGLHPSSGSYQQQMLSILSDIKQAVNAEEAEESASQALGSFQWEYQTRNGQWVRFSIEHNISIESDRRSNKQTAEIIDQSGQTMIINFATHRDNRGVAVRPMPMPEESKSDRSSSSSTSTPTPQKTTFHFQSSSSSSCGACMCSFDNQETVQFTVSGCGHSVLCTDCMTKYIATKITEKDIFPWLKCPQENCNQDLQCVDLLNACVRHNSSSSSSSSSSASRPLLTSLCTTYLEKWIVRYPEWTPCTSSSCTFGFLVTNSMENKRLSCEVCGTAQTVQRKKEEHDESLKNMIADGTLRPCPTCQLLTMKEFGVCNVIDCQQCSIVWNWRTRETGRTTRELKQKARSRGTLWEAGELAYQQNLQRTNKKEFVKLLERNGVKYDPNYRRGM